MPVFWIVHYVGDIEVPALGGDIFPSISFHSLALYNSTALTREPYFFRIFEKPACTSDSFFNTTWRFSEIVNTAGSIFRHFRLQLFSISYFEFARLPFCGKRGT